MPSCGYESKLSNKSQIQMLGLQIEKKPFKSSHNEPVAQQRRLFQRIRQDLGGRNGKIYQSDNGDAVAEGSETA
eukprot:2233411-Amphidinium_carterae.1